MFRPQASPWRHFLVFLLGLFLWMPFAFSAPPSAESAEEALPPESQEIPSGEAGDPALDAEYVTGYVLSVKAASPAENLQFKSPIGSMDRVENVTVKMTSGSWSGRTVTVVNHLSGHPAFDVQVEPGASVVLIIERLPGQLPDINLADRDRTPVLNLVLGLVLLGALLLSGRPGLIVLALTGMSLFALNQWVIPGIFAGEPSLFPMGCLLGLVLVVISQLWELNTEARRMTLIGTVAGSLVVALTMALIAQTAPLKGFSNEALASLWQMNPHIDFQGLLVSGVLLAHIGLIFHSVKQLVRQLTSPEHLTALEPLQPFSRRWLEAIRQGRDTLASVLFGLIFIYLGYYFPLLLETTNVALEKFINLESTATILASALSGCMGVLSTLPITAALVAREASPSLVD